MVWALPCARCKRRASQRPTRVTWDVHATANDLITDCDLQKQIYWSLNEVSVLLNIAKAEGVGPTAALLPPPPAVRQACRNVPRADASLIAVRSHHRQRGQPHLPAAPLSPRSNDVSDLESTFSGAPLFAILDSPTTPPSRRLTAPVRRRCGAENVRSKHRATLSSRLRSKRSYRSRNSRPFGVSRVPEARLPPGCRSSKRNPAAFSSSRRYPQAFRYDISNRSTACLIEPSSSIRRRSAARPWPNFTVSPKNTQTLSFGFIVFIIARQSQAAAVLPLCRLDYTSSVSYREPGISTLPDFAQGSYVCCHHSVIGAWYSRTDAGKSTPRKLPCGNCVEVRMIWS